jgi:predicted HTH transcriptional regulator
MRQFLGHYPEPDKPVKKIYPSNGKKRCRRTNHYDLIETAKSLKQFTALKIAQKCFISEGFAEREIKKLVDKNILTKLPKSKVKEKQIFVLTENISVTNS